MIPANVQITSEHTGYVYLESIDREFFIDSQLYDRAGNLLPAEERGLTDEQVGRIYALGPGESMTFRDAAEGGGPYVLTCLENKDREIPNTNQIQAFSHCALYLQENPPGETGTSMEEYARLSVGMTPIGWQVWCVRHDVNVVHVDYRGLSLPANTRRAE